MRDKLAHSSIFAIVQLLISVFAVLLPTIALAAAIPPPYLWFVFDRAPESVQLVECQSLTSSTEPLLCEQPTLLIQSGICQVAGCLTEKQILKPPYQLHCAETICLYEEPRSKTKSEPIFKLVAQIPGASTARSSPPFRTRYRSPIAGYRDRHLNVSVAQYLRIRPDDQLKPSRWEVFGTALSLTLVSEIAIALLFLAILRLNKNQALQILLLVGFANLLTFPVFWFFFPSLQFFQYASTRVFGVFNVLISVIFSVVLIKRKAITARIIIRTGIIWFFSLPIALLLAFIAAFIVGYSEFLPSVAGISQSMTLPASMIYTIVWEAWIIERSQSYLSRYQVYLLSLLMNLISLAVGLTFLPTLRQFG